MELWQCLFLCTIIVYDQRQQKEIRKKAHLHSKQVAHVRKGMHTAKAMPTAVPNCLGVLSYTHLQRKNGFECH